MEGGAEVSPEAQRIAIAEACGIVSKDQWGPLYRTQYGIVRDCHDYLNDLNAMHEAVMTLNVKQRSEFRNQLQYLIAPSTKPNLKVSGIKVMGSHHYDEWWHATAAQRAEAFLRTIGEWKEARNV